jgi:tetratricopeptide (TPR) repeat protein
VAYFTRALDLGADALSPDERVETLLARGEVRARLLGDHAGGLADFTAAAAVPAASEAGIVRALLGQGKTYSYQYRLDEALQCYEQALARAAAAGCRVERVEVLLQKALALGEQERDRDFEQARGCVAEALQLSRSMEDRGLEIQSLVQLGTLQYNAREVAESVRSFDECIALCHAAGDRASLSLALQNLSRSHLALGNWERAEQVCLELRDVLVETGDSRRLAGCSFNLGAVYQGQGRYAEAVACFREALARFRALRNPDLVQKTLRMLAWLYDALGQTADLADALDQLVVVLREAADGEDVTQPLVDLGHARRQLGEPLAAEAAYAEAAKQCIDASRYAEAARCLEWIEEVRRER